MSEIVKLRTRLEIDEEAAVWTWRLDSEEVTAAEQRAFDSWLRQDPRHRRAMDELSKVWNALEGLAEAKRDEKIAAFATGERPAVRRVGRPWWFAVAAMFVLMVVGVAWLHNGKEVQTLATAVGQQRNVTLADGSVISLNTNTIVETNLGQNLREIYLRKGEAHFQVARDRSRPFLVHAGDAVVRAVGTQFEVRVRSDQHVDIVVNEGRVEVQADAPQTGLAGTGGRRGVSVAPTVRAVSAGQELSTALAGYPVVPVSPQQISSDLAWREGAIVFDDVPLAEAISEIERYTDARIVVSNPQIAAMRLGGRFKTDDVQGLFVALEAALPVSIRRTPDGVVYIDPRR
jgi:transmembrane sensor